MHPNLVFRNASRERNLEFAEERGFAILAVGGENSSRSPHVSHIPFTLAEGGGGVHAHLVRSNPIAQNLRAGERKAALAVSVPDAYVSPAWHARMPDQVPTWNSWTARGSPIRTSPTRSAVRGGTRRGRRLRTGKGPPRRSHARGTRSAMTPTLSELVSASDAARALHGRRAAPHSPVRRARCQGASVSARRCAATARAAPHAQERSGKPLPPHGGRPSQRPRA